MRSRGFDLVPIILGLVLICCVASYSQQLTSAEAWSRQLGGPGADSANGLAIDPIGDVFVVGTFAGTVDFGGGPVTSFGGSDIFVAKYSGATGAHMWSNHYLAPSNDFGSGVAVDTSGNIFVTGSNTAGGPGVILMKISGADGSQIWLRNIGDFTSVAIKVLVAVDGNGNPVITWGSVPPAIQKYDGLTGAILWSRTMIASPSASTNGIAIQPVTNAVYIIGGFHGGLNFGAGTPGWTTPPGGGTDAYLVKFAGADGSYLWSDAWGLGHEIGNSVAVDNNGGVFFTGSFGSPQVGFGGALLNNSGGCSAFLVKYYGDTHAWSRAFGGSGPTDCSSGTGVALDAFGNPFLTGTVQGSSNFGGGVTSAGVVVAAYVGSSGAYQWSRGFSTGSVAAIAVDSPAHPFLAGTFASPTIDLGSGVLTNAGGSDGFIAKLSVAPTAALVNVSGRVRNAGGRGVVGAIVSVVDGAGQTRRVRTNAFGYFSFSGLTAGQSCVFIASAKNIGTITRIIGLTDDISHLDLMP
ncbi:MAG: SBBP repeat-containing protein [Pyrinomonadaceae bacterium]